MADDVLPFRADDRAFITFEREGSAPVLSYNVPQPSEYTGRYYLELLFDDKIWHPDAQPRPAEPTAPTSPPSPPPPPPPPTGGGTRPGGRPNIKPQPSKSIALDQLRPGLNATQDLLSDIVAQIPHDVKIPPLGPPIDIPRPGGTNSGLDQLFDLADLSLAGSVRPPELLRLDALVRKVGVQRLVAEVRSGARLAERRTLDNRVVYSLVPPPDPVLRKPRIAIVHVCRLSSYLGEYGAGRTISTFSLLPGEQHQIEIKTYRRSKQTNSEASSILDSFEETVAEEFQNDLTSENSSQNTEEENFTYQAQAETSATWGWGQASASGSVSGSTTGKREELSKNVASTTQKHSATAAAKRQVEINTTSQTETEEGEESAVKRTIENINVGRALNFVFRQMNQVFVSALSIVDVRIAFRNGDPADDREYTLPELEEFLNAKVVQAAHPQVKKAIWDALYTCFNWKNDHTPLIEGALLQGSADEGAMVLTTTPDRDKADYWRFRRQVSDLEPVDGADVTVPGVVIGVTRSTLPTDGVVVDALLGQGNALDAYSMGLQMEAVEEKRLANERVEANIDILRMKADAVRNRDKDQAALISQIFPSTDASDDG